LLYITIEGFGLIDKIRKQSIGSSSNITFINAGVKVSANICCYSFYIYEYAYKYLHMINAQIFILCTHLNCDYVYNNVEKLIVNNDKDLSRIMDIFPNLYCLILNDGEHENDNILIIVNNYYTRININMRINTHHPLFDKLDIEAGADKYLVYYRIDEINAIIKTSYYFGMIKNANK
jgi:hypothetical protein